MQGVYGRGAIHYDRGGSTGSVNTTGGAQVPPFHGPTCEKIHKRRCSSLGRILRECFHKTGVVVWGRLLRPIDRAGGAWYNGA